MADLEQSLRIPFDRKKFEDGDDKMKAEMVENLIRAVEAMYTRLAREFAEVWEAMP